MPSLLSQTRLTITIAEAVNKIFDPPRQRHHRHAIAQQRERRAYEGGTGDLVVADVVDLDAENKLLRYSVPMRAGSTSRTTPLEAAGAAVPAGRRMVNTDPLLTSLVTVTSPPIMRQSLRVMARPNPVPPY